MTEAKSAGCDLQVYLSTAWECPFEGAVDPDVVVELSARLLELGASQVVISDTIGAAHPGEVRALLSRLVDTVGASVLAAQLKSLRFRPPLLWVHQVTVTLPYSVSRAG